MGSLSCSISHSSMYLCYQSCLIAAGEYLAFCVTLLKYAEEGMRIDFLEDNSLVTISWNKEKSNDPISNLGKIFLCLIREQNDFKVETGPEEPPKNKQGLD